MKSIAAGIILAGLLFAGGALSFQESRHTRRLAEAQMPTVCASSAPATTGLPSLAAVSGISSAMVWVLKPATPSVAVFCFGP